MNIETIYRHEEKCMQTCNNWIGESFRKIKIDYKIITIHYNKTEQDIRYNDTIGLVITSNEVDITTIHCSLKQRCGVDITILYGWL